MKFKLPTCHECKRTTTADNILRLLLNKKTGKYVDICRKCFPRVYGKFLKEAKASKLVEKTPEYQDGARDIDYKSYIEKWSKKMAK